MAEKTGITKNGIEEICTVEGVCKRHHTHFNSTPIKAKPLKAVDVIDIIINDRMEIFIDGNGRKVDVHASGQCAGQNCSIHNPSNHVLKDAPLTWRSDRRMMERICSHGVGHPDPDDVSYNVMVLDKDEESYSMHGCDGCCSNGTMVAEASAAKLSVKESDLLPWTGMSLQQARSKLTSLHFAKEGLTEGEREILYIAEALLRQIDESK